MNDTWNNLARMIQRRKIIANQGWASGQAVGSERTPLSPRSDRTAPVNSTIIKILELTNDKTDTIRKTKGATSSRNICYERLTPPSKAPERKERLGSATLSMRPTKTDTSEVSTMSKSCANCRYVTLGDDVRTCAECGWLFSVARPPHPNANEQVIKPVDANTVRLTVHNADGNVSDIIEGPIAFVLNHYTLRGTGLRVYKDRRK